MAVRAPSAPAGQFRDVLCERGYVFLPGVPGAHQAATERSNERVKLPPAPAQSVNHWPGQFGKHRVRLARKQDFHWRNWPQLFFEQRGHPVRVRRVPQPGAILEHPDPWRSNEPHLACELAALLAAIVELPRQLAIENYH